MEKQRSHLGARLLSASVASSRTRHCRIPLLHSLTGEVAVPFARKREEKSSFFCSEFQRGEVSNCRLCRCKSNTYSSPQISQAAFRGSSVSSFFPHFMPCQHSANHFSVRQHRRLMYVGVLKFPPHQLGNDGQTEKPFTALR